MQGKGLPSSRIASPEIAKALQAWQETADESWLEYVILETRPRLEDVARDVLRHLRIGDWSAVDDTISLVFDHLRRLPLTTTGERAVARFDTNRSTGDRAGDPGLAYLVWLTRERALDVARKRRRLATHCRLFATSRQAFLVDRADFDGPTDADDTACDATARLQAALATLEPRLGTVVELLLDGKSQATIAHVLGVCEGTVSRLRTKAIVELKRLMQQ